MNAPAWFRRTRIAPPSAEAMPDPETGELIEPVREDDAPAAEVAGERTIPSVNRERSMHSRIANVLTVGTIVLIGLAFLGWYYVGQFERSAEAKAAAKKAEELRASGELRLAPLGRIDPPRLEPVAASAAAVSPGLPGMPPPPPPMPAYAAQPAGQPQKTPEQLALERKLGQPVLLKAQAGTAAPTMPAAFATTAQMPPGVAAFMGGMTPTSDASTSVGATPLAAMLRPTPTPAVSAQVLPTRRFLLPKGAFLDCTLETAIDSTFDGMVTCIGATDVYGADGKVVLLERGTKYVGEKRGDLHQGQGRVFVLWNEARTPTGVVVNLASPGTDELGRAGLPGFVDTHFWDRFGAAILISVIDGVVQAAAASQQSTDRSVVVSPQGGHDVLTEVLKSTVAIPPTVVKNQGDRIQVLVARDVDFRAVYALRSDAEGSSGDGR
ncbi:MAG: type IV secretion system protein VirB10 [Proteobacteria bacterium]|nr:type IV secretion system protein VirB10 [Pseudomonadota bacterium]